MATGTALAPIVLMGLIGHQLFKRLETFDIFYHISVLFGPIFLGAATLLSTSPPLKAVYISASTYLASLIFATLVYRVSPFHPLAIYPGPFGCRLTKFWMAAVSFTGQQHNYIKSLHDRYGDVVRIGPNEVSIKDPSVVHAMLGPAGLPHGPMYYGKLLVRTPEDMPMLGMMDTAKHLGRRRPWARAFSGVALKEYEPMVALRALQLVHALQSQQGEVDIGTWVNYYSYDFMCDMAFGGGSELLRDGDVHNFWHTLEKGLPPSTFVSHVPWLGPYLARIPAITADMQKVLAHCQRLTTGRIKRGAQRRDLFHYLNNEDEPETQPPSLQQVVNEGVVAVVAGSDTVSITLTSIFFCLATHPEAYRRLEEEVDRFYPPGQDPCDTEHHRDMHYLTAVIKETLCMYPTVPSGVQRCVPHDSNGVTLGSIFLPPGTSAWYHQLSVHHDPRHFFPKTDNFWPEHWLLASGHLSFADTDTADETTFVHNEGAFVPFSYGPMNCVGKNLAMLEMRIVLCVVLQKFRLHLRDGWDPRTYGEGLKDFFVTTRPPVPVTLVPRF